MKKPARPERNEDFSQELLTELGDEGFLVLLEAYAGTRLYVPEDLAKSDLAETVGFDIAARLSKRYPCSYMRVPVAKDFRAIQYRKQGASNRDIARRLGMTESGVDGLLQRMKKKKPAEFRRKKDPRQTDMFD